MVEWGTRDGRAGPDTGAAAGFACGQFLRTGGCGKMTGVGSPGAGVKPGGGGKQIAGEAGDARRSMWEAKCVAFDMDTRDQRKGGGRGERNL